MALSDVNKVLQTRGVVCEDSEARMGRETSSMENNTCSRKFARAFGRCRTSDAGKVLIIIVIVVFVLKLRNVDSGASSIKFASLRRKVMAEPPASPRSSASKSSTPLSETSQSTDSNTRLKILELSYMRSGSTFCGDILQTPSDVFYVYESLWYFYDYYQPRWGFNKSVPFRSRVKPRWRDSKPYIPKPLDFISYMFRCNLTAYNMEFLTNIAHSRDFAKRDCKARREDAYALVNPSPACVKGVLQRCLNSSAIVQKVLRLSMEEVDEYLDQDPSVRVIHILRDPRGIILSRMHFTKGTKNPSDMYRNHTSLCLRLWDDLKWSKKIAKKHWGKILTVRYEDLAQDPLFIVATMYKFAGLKLDSSVRNYVHQLTTSDVLDNGARVKTARQNPLKTAYNWRQELPFDQVQDIERACTDVLRELGYYKFSSEEELRDMMLPAKNETYGHSLMTPWTMLD